MSEPFPIGCTVLTPLWRLATVTGYTKEYTHAYLRYVGVDENDTVTLRVGLLRLPPT